MEMDEPSIATVISLQQDILAFAAAWMGAPPKATILACWGVTNGGETAT